MERDAPPFKRLPSANDKEVGFRLKAARIKARRSRQFVADAARIPVESLEYYELAMSRVPPDRLVALAAILGVSVAWIKSGADRG